MTMKKGLLVIDMIDGIVENGSCSPFVKEYPVLNHINQLIRAFKERAFPVYFVRLAFSEGYPDYPKNSTLFNYAKEQHRFLMGSQDVAFVEGLAFQEKRDRIFNKTATSPFHHSGLLEAIRADHVEHLIFTGVATDNAINIGSRFAHDEGYKTTVVADACGASTFEAHESALKLLEKIVNDITNTSDFIAAL